MLRRIKNLTKATIGRTIDRMTDSRANPAPIARIAINMRPVNSAWGGGNSWSSQLTRWLRLNGYSVRFDLHGRVDCIIIADPRPSGTVLFGPDDIALYLEKNPKTACLHRINENDRHRKSDIINGLLDEANDCADHTVFISEWLRDYHAARWFAGSRPHSIITNGADPKTYHPLGRAEFLPGEPLRLVTHHWSNNWRKGFHVYQEIDTLIADGSLPGIELWIIGRWPDEIDWRAARTFTPTHGRKLAQLLRDCHVYVTASLWESGGMHFIEGAQCGLPLLYHLDGGGIVEVGRKFGLGFRDDIREAVLRIREHYGEFRQAVLQWAPSGDQMCLEYRRLIQHLIVSKSEESKPILTESPPSVAQRDRG